MIDATKYMIVAKGKIETSRIDTCVKNPATNKYDIKFTNGRTYSYMPSNVLVLGNPSVLNPENYLIKTSEGKKLFGAKCIYQFANGSELYWDGERCEPQYEAGIDTYEDHRMALAFAPAAFRIEQLRVNNPQVVTKSYPKFWEDIKAAGFDVNSEQ